MPRAAQARGVEASIVLLTARWTKTDMVLGLEIGADDYVPKPYSPRSFEHACAPGSAGPARRPTRCPCASATASWTSTRASCAAPGKLVPTTPLELKLLSLFARRPGRVLTRRTLIDDVWGHDTSITERVVDNRITHLQRKIELSPAAPRFLKSVQDIGYRFDLEDVTEP